MNAVALASLKQRIHYLILLLTQHRLAPAYITDPLTQRASVALNYEQ